MDPQIFKLTLSAFSILLGVLGVLLITIWNAAWNRLRKLEERLDNKISEMKKEMDAKMKISMRGLEKLEHRLEREQERTQDLSETVAGFSGTYVTRKEFNDRDINRTQFLGGKT